MSKVSDKALLPAGMCDVLPPDAEREASTTEQIIAHFLQSGYERVKPPLIEFEESLLSNGGGAMSGQTFRLMDPISQRMMGVRADMTLQIARIATTRLKKMPRPIRLCYSGEVLRVRGNQMRPERQFGQVGSEIIGSHDPKADAEVILMAIEALRSLGIKDLSVDLALPTLVPAIINNLDIDNETSVALRAALDRKDEATILSFSNKITKKTTEQLTALLRATGPDKASLNQLNKLNFSEVAKLELSSLKKVHENVTNSIPDLKLTVDPIESRGLEYHTGVTFTIFSKGVRGELGQGGRYLTGENEKINCEPATGITLFLDSLLRAMPTTDKKKRLYIPPDVEISQIRKYQSQGWVTVAGFKTTDNAKIEAERLLCSHILLDGSVQQV